MHHAFTLHASALHASEASGAAVSVGIEPIVTGVDRDVAPGDIYGDRLETLVTGVEEDDAAFYVQLGVTVYAVVPDINGQCGIRESKAVIDMNAVVGCGNRDGSARDYKGIVDVNAMLISGCDCQAAAAVDGQVVV